MLKFDLTRTSNLNPQLIRTHWILVPKNVLELNWRTCFKIIKVSNEFENKEYSLILYLVLHLSQTVKEISFLINFDYRLLLA